MEGLNSNSSEERDIESAKEGIKELAEIMGVSEQEMDEMMLPLDYATLEMDGETPNEHAMELNRMLVERDELPESDPKRKEIEDNIRNKINSLLNRDK
jgi:hypothetical protein